MAMGVLLKRRLVAVEPDPVGGRAKVARLTPKGREAQDAYHRLVGIIEERASVRKPSTLPHYPMVLHRGGFPDGG